MLNEDNFIIVNYKNCFMIVVVLVLVIKYVWLFFLVIYSCWYWFRYFVI